MRSQNVFPEEVALGKRSTYPFDRSAATAGPNGARTRRSEGGLKWAAEELRPDTSRLTPRQRSRLPRYLKIPLLIVCARRALDIDGAVQIFC